MRIGILSDTHNRVARTASAVEELCNAGAEVLVHCGDLACPEIVTACSVLPFYFVFGNHDADVVPALREVARECGATCLGWGGEFSVADKRIAVVHGHIGQDVKPLLEAKPDYMFSGHSHIAKDWTQGTTRRINPGALFRASRHTVCVLDLVRDDLRTIEVTD